MIAINNAVSLLQTRIAMARVDLREEQEKEVPSITAIELYRGRVEAAEADLRYIENSLLDT